MTLTIGHTSVPPRALQTAMTSIKLVDDETAAGTLVLSGVAPSSQGRRHTLSKGELTVRESANSRMLIDGFAGL